MKLKYKYCNLCDAKLIFGKDINTIHIQVEKDYFGLGRKYGVFAETCLISNIILCNKCKKKIIKPKILKNKNITRLNTTDYKDKKFLYKK